MRTVSHLFRPAIAGMALAWASSSVPSFAQTDIHGPVSGYLYDSAAKEIRAILGVPGAALLSPALDTGGDISNATVLPDSDRAIVIDSLTGESRLVDWTRGAAQVYAMPGAPRHAVQILASSLGSVVAIRSAEEPVVCVYQITAGEPQLRQRMEIPAGSHVLAVTDDGAALLISGDQSASVRKSSGKVFAFPFGDIKAGAFRPGTEEAATVTAEGSVWLSSAANARLLSQGNPAAAAGLAFSRDGRYLVAVRSGTPTIAIFDFTDDSATQIPNTCAPAQIRRLTGAALFQICNPSDGASRVLELNATRSRLILVPPDADQ
jgi:sugar lactone lactonase YvrE